MVYVMEAGTHWKRNEVFLRRVFILWSERGEYDRQFMLPSSFLMRSNLEICPHVCFGSDCATGTGTFHRILDQYYQRQHRDWSLAVSADKAWQPEPFTGYICQDCCMEVCIDFNQHKSRASVLVYQHLGPPKRNVVQVLFDEGVKAWKRGTLKLLRAKLA
ncbi:uncharacterized protein EI97DRAFT_430956 [Westerdykella ornata]|uniref:Uncharacterized protein n=1 Tax=Westerdykella ornata TaxID=318751 RepID=A0A6A6JUI8_WESOR|nr:uncharacterized protein EI97DRAFT_430956 [Westerdykella ornata]KAF2278699.1 hypothetical protein EI97DRAFT_430956 [Westerdykella ornata]